MHRKPWNLVRSRWSFSPRCRWDSRFPPWSSTRAHGKEENQIKSERFPSFFFFSFSFTPTRIATSFNPDPLISIKLNSFLLASYNIRACACEPACRDPGMCLQLGSFRMTNAVSPHWSRTFSTNPLYHPNIRDCVSHLDSIARNSVSARGTFTRYWIPLSVLPSTVEYIVHFLRSCINTCVTCYIHAILRSRSLSYMQVRYFRVYLLRCVMFFSRYLSHAEIFAD